MGNRAVDDKKFQEQVQLHPVFQQLVGHLRPPAQLRPCNHTQTRPISDLLKCMDCGDVFEPSSREEDPDYGRRR